MALGFLESKSQDCAGGSYLGVLVDVPEPVTGRLFRETYGVVPVLQIEVIDELLVVILDVSQLQGEKLFAPVMHRQRREMLISIQEVAGRK